MKREFVLFHNGGIGDFLMFIFLSEQLWRGGRAEHITIVVPRAGKFLRELTAAYSYLRVVETSLKRPQALPALVSGMHRRRTVLLHPTLGRIPLYLKFFAWAITRNPASELIGFKDAGPLCATLYSKVLVYDTDKNYADLMRQTARVLGGAVNEEPPHLKLTPSSKDSAEMFVKGEYVVFHPGAGISARKRSFEADEAIEIVRHILKKHPAFSVVLSGGSDERPLIEEVQREIANTRVVAAVGVTGQELANLVRGATLYIGGDTGITHLACFVGARVLEVAHHATTHWLCFYHPRATVLYRLRGEEEARTSWEHLQMHARDTLRPFDRVPTTAVCTQIDQLLSATV